ncbi:MAG: sigma 54-interacting transcriptional regulator [Alphaproteobacteria bacterium]
MRVLIVGSLNGQIAAATKIAMDRGAKVQHVDTIVQATAALRAGRGADLLMVDVSLDIAALIAANEAEHIAVPIVACGIKTDARTAGDAIRAGAKEFIPLPPDAELIAAVLAAVCDDERPMIAEDQVMRDVMAMADQVAASDASILITGESGAGKEVMARYLHNKSKRKDAAFIAVNCAAIPENLLESELFGHEKGAFTGAVARRIGKFEEANGGTLLLDEISEMDARLQAKLLRAIQERVIDRVGGAKPVPVNIRIIATLQPRSGAGRARRRIPPGFALSSQCRESASPCLARAAQGSAEPRAILHREIRRRQWPSLPAPRDRSADAGDVSPLARQRSRTRKRDAPRSAAEQRCGDRP